MLDMFIFYFVYKFILFAIVKDDTVKAIETIVLTKFQNSICRKSNGGD